MTNPLFALLVYNDPEHFDSLTRALEYLSVATYPVRTCRDVEGVLALIQPHLIFTDTFLPDGSWVDVVKRSKESKAPVNVIVVGGAADTQFHISVVNRGGYDFIAPPFDLAPLALAVRMAAQDTESHGQIAPRVSFIGSHDIGDARLSLSRQAA